MKKKNNSYHVIEQVPPDYYQKGIKNNLLQKVWHTRKLEVVVGEIKETPHSILDVGCASGWFLFQLSKRFKKASCVGIDIYKDAIEYGKKKYSKIKFRVADAHKIPYKANTFDLVICTEVLEHIDHPETVLKEIKRVLKKNGIAVIELDSGSALFSISWFLWRIGKGGVWKDAHLHSFNPDKLEKLIKKAGFKILRSQKFNLGMAMIFTVKNP